MNRELLARFTPQRLGEGRTFLIVGGPFGAFTRELGRDLRGAGARCLRVILNGGDVYDWGWAHGRVYRGDLHGFSAWVAGLMGAEEVTDILIYGDTHPYCAAAAKVATARNVSVHVLEQGYFRPFWITLESEGVNGASRLPRDPRAYLEEASGLASPKDEWLAPLTPPAVKNLMIYHFLAMLAAPAFPRFRPAYAYSVPRQAIGHLFRYLDQRLFRRRHRRQLAQALDTAGPLFIGVLQRPGDSQLKVHSPFRNQAEFIEHVVASFARQAPADARLLFKSHPLDNGVESLGRSVARAAKAHGAQSRVFFTDVGDLQLMLPPATGVVTVNSTAGLAAMGQGRPTIALGVAIYDLPGLTHQGGLDSFWTAPEAPDRTLYEAFRRVVIRRCQVSGAFASLEGVRRAVPGVVERLLSV